MIASLRHRGRSWLLVLLPVSFMLFCYTRLDRHMSILKDLTPETLRIIGGGSSSSAAKWSLFLDDYDSDGDAEAGEVKAMPAIRIVRGGTPPSEAMLQFWRDMLSAMLAAQPELDETVVVEDGVTDYDTHPNPAIDQDRPRIDKTHLPDFMRDELRRAHAQFLLSAKVLGKQLPYEGWTPPVHKGDAAAAAAAAAATINDMKVRGGAAATLTSTATSSSATSTSSTSTPSPLPTRGIVMTAGGPYVGIAVTSLLMLRRSGSRLPVELFLDTDDDYDVTLCESVLPRLGAECRIMQRFWDTTPTMPPLKKYQSKVFAVLLSSFREVLFLDADCWPLRDPDHLFDVEPFFSTGLVTWPDFWLSTAVPALYEMGDSAAAGAKPGKNGAKNSILGIPEPKLTDRRSSESGILLYDKARHATGLLLAAYYNFYGPGYYYPLFSQGAAGEGDKETFLHGALVAGAPFYDVRTPIGILGRFMNGTYKGAAMLQHDPVEDYQQKIQMAQKAQTEESQKGKGQKEQKGQGPQKFSAGPMFVHHNLVKIDIAHLGKSMERVYESDETKGINRLWDVGEDFNQRAGYNVERRLWEEVLRARCGSHMRQPVQSKECDDLRAYYQHVFS